MLATIAVLVCGAVTWGDLAPKETPAITWAMLAPVTADEPLMAVAL